MRATRFGAIAQRGNGSIDLETATWAEISAISRAGTGSRYWSVGDTKTIHLNGRIGTVNYTEYTVQLFILDFNHVENGVADTGILWGGYFKNGIGFVHTQSTNYGNTNRTGSKWYNMNHWGGTSSPYNTNRGGWAGCDMRYDVLGGTSTAPSGYGSTPTASRVGYDATNSTITNPVEDTLMSALPSDFRSVLQLRTHYVDNVGYQSNIDANVTAVTDAISLLAEYEVFGERSLANEYEQNHQSQMAYFANGGSTIMYYTDEEPKKWWLASPNYNSVYSFCNVEEDGTLERENSRVSLGIFPVFKT